ncbi:MAG: RsmE family RNA methyltransferase, partial [Candidatus Acidiferrales bacterium]
RGSFDKAAAGLGSLGGRSFSSDIDAQQNRGASAPEDSAAATVALAIGPEGGWTDGEIASARAAGFLEASLGENILRTETAVLASMAILGFALGG